MTDIHFGLVIQAEPSVEPILTADAKSHLRVDVSDDDDLIDGLVKAARTKFENDTNRALITQTWDLYLDRFPDNDKGINIPRYPLQSITHIKYCDTDGIEQTWANTNYTVDIKSRPARITTAYNITYPTTREIINAINIRFIAGYGAAGSDVPQDMIQVINMLLGHWYEHREAVVSGVTPKIVPLGYKFLYMPHKVFIL